MERDLPEPHPDLTTEQKLDMIVLYLHRMDRRERIKFVGGIVHSILAFVPLILSIAALWYLYTHGAELISESVKGVFTGGQSSSEQQGFMEQIQEYFKK